MYSVLLGFGRSSQLTQRSVSRSGTGVGNLLTVGVHTPALTDAGVALCGLIGSVLVTLRDVVTDSGPRAEGGEAGGGGGGGLDALSVTFTLGLLTL